MSTPFWKALCATAGSAVLVLIAPGCTSPNGEPNNTGTGALIGGASGAGLGALVAHENPAAGAIIGGAAGLITGGLIGNAMDQQAHAPVYVAAPPQPSAVESPPPAPGPGYIWQRGQWMWGGNQWVWVPGQWVAAPTPQAVWIPPGWVRGPYGWYWQPGHWQ